MMKSTNFGTLILWILRHKSKFTTISLNSLEQFWWFSGFHSSIKFLCWRNLIEEFFINKFFFKLKPSSFSPLNWKSSPFIVWTSVKSFPQEIVLIVLSFMRREGWRIEFPKVLVFIPSPPASPNWRSCPSSKRITEWTSPQQTEIIFLSLIERTAFSSLSCLSPVPSWLSRKKIKKNQKLKKKERKRNDLKLPISVVAVRPFWKKIKKMKKERKWETISLHFVRERE